MILLILQPLMDILSFWTDRLGMSNTITLLLRFAVFAVVCVLGFVTSSRKKVYGIAIAACAFLLVGHCISCFIVGYQRIVYDLTNFVRVVQMPLFVLCFISFLRANEKCYRAFETGLMLDFWIITASVVVSVLTHTSSATYQSTNVGILGWYSFGNAQSAIMSILCATAERTSCCSRSRASPHWRSSISWARVWHSSRSPLPRWACRSCWC